MGVIVALVVMTLGVLMVRFSGPLGKWYAKSYPRDSVEFFEAVFSIGVIAVGIGLTLLGLLILLNAIGIFKV